jgi:hypothetical protein
MATDDAQPEPYEPTSRWSLENWVDAAVAWVLVGGATVLILAAITVVTVSVLGMGA